MKLINKNANTAIISHLKRFSHYYIIFFAVTLTFILLELKYPYHFLQDDTRGYFLPQFVYNYKSLLNFEIPLYNFHQFLGTPELACMLNAALYPPVYLSVFLSSILFGHVFGSVEILVYVHLLLAGFAFYKFLECMGFAKNVALLGAVTWPLTSFVVFASSAWVHVAMTAAYFPLVLFFSINLYKTQRIKYLVGVVTARVLLFFSGHTEYFLYCMIFESLTLAAVAVHDIAHSIRSKEWNKPGRTILSKASFVLAGYLLTIAFSLPLLLPALQQISVSAEKSGMATFDGFIYNATPMLDWLTGLLNPFQKDGAIPENWAHLHNLSFTGYIPLIFFFITIFEIVRKRIKGEKADSLEIRTYIMSVFCVVTLLWATNTGFFALFVHKIPILNSTSLHFKFTFFVNFYLITVSAYGAHLLLERSRNNSKTARRFDVYMYFAALIQVITLASLYIILPQQYFGVHHDKLPYDEPLAARLVGGRYIAGGFQIFGLNPNNASSTNVYSFPPIAFNYASLWGMYAFAGYETLIAGENADVVSGLNGHGTYIEPSEMPVELLRRWGVKWYIMSPNANLENPSAREIWRDSNRIVYEDPEARPLFYFEKPENANVQIEYKINVNSIDLAFTSAASDTLILNFIYNPCFKAHLDNNQAAVSANDHKQMTVYAPKGKHTLKVEYQDPRFFTGSLIAFVSGIACCALLVLRAFVFKNKSARPMRSYGNNVEERP